MQGHREIRQTGAAGKLFRFVFFAFNVLMAIWLVAYWAQLSGMSASSDAERAGAAIGGTIGTVALMLFWGVGAGITGLLMLATRGPRLLVPIEDGVPIRKPHPLWPYLVGIGAFIVYALSLRGGPELPQTTAGGGIFTTPDEARLIDIVADARQAYRAGANDMAKGAARPARAHALCAVFPRLDVNDWTGKVAVLSTNNDGRGILSVEIAKDVQITTWNNALSDASSNTLLAPDSALFRKAVALHVGQSVTFAGTFFAATPDCIKESSLTIEGAMTKPEFIFRFSNLLPHS
jgi:hypothetical protein